MIDEITKIAAAIGAVTDYNIVPVICPMPTTYGIPGFYKCSEKRCGGFITQRTERMAEVNMVVGCRYCKPFEFDLPVILEKRR